MMDPNIILIAILAIPVLILMILRINAAQVFLSLCLGSVLVQFVASDAAALVSSSSAHAKGIPTGQAVVNLALLLLPVLLTSIIMIRSVKGRAKLAYNLLPATGVAALGALLAVPLLSYSMTSSIVTLPLWRQLQNFQTLIISVNTLLALLFLWMQRSRSASKDESSKH